MDNAVALFGSTLEAELESIEGKNAKDTNTKRERKMTDWLDLPRKYRSPMGTKSSIDADVEVEFTVSGGIT